MSGIDDELDQAEAYMRDNTTSAAKEVDLDYPENTLDQAGSIQQDFEQAHDGIEPSQENSGQEQGQVSHDYQPNRDGPQPEGPGFDAQRSEGWDQRQQNLMDQEAANLQEGLEQENGIDDQNGVGLENDGHDDHNRGR